MIGRARAMVLMKTSLDDDGGGGGGDGGLLPVEGRPVCLPGGIPRTADADAAAAAVEPYRVPPALNHRRYCLPVRGPIYD